MRFASKIVSVLQHQGFCLLVSVIPYLSFHRHSSNTSTGVPILLSGIEQHPSHSNDEIKTLHFKQYFLAGRDPAQSKYRLCGCLHRGQIHSTDFLAIGLLSYLGKVTCTHFSLAWMYCQISANRFSCGLAGGSLNVTISSAIETSAWLRLGCVASSFGNLIEFLLI